MYPKTGVRKMYGKKPVCIYCKCPYLYKFMAHGFGYFLSAMSAGLVRWALSYRYRLVSYWWRGNFDTNKVISSGIVIFTLHYEALHLYIPLIIN